MAGRLRCPCLNFHSIRLDNRGLSVWPIKTITGAMWARATITPQRVAMLGERGGRIFTLENLDLAMDHLGTPFVRTEDTLVLVSVVNSPGLHTNLNLYRTQIGEGNLIELCRRIPS